MMKPTKPSQKSRGIFETVSLGDGRIAVIQDEITVGIVRGEDELKDWFAKRYIKRPEELSLGYAIRRLG